MLPYLLLFGFFAVGALLEQARAGERRTNFLFGFGALAMIVMIGLRFRVGADWDNYRGIFRRTANVDLWTAMADGDPGYQMLNWIANQAGAGMWLVNLVCALVFVWGLVRFAAGQPNRWLVVLVAIPYMVIVVAMGYSRQGAALGIILAGLANFLRRESILRLAAYAVVAALFHATAVVVFPLVALAAQRNRLVNVLVAGSIGFLLYSTFIEPNVETFVDTYLTARYNSQGAAIRVAINAVAALVFFAGRHALIFSDQERAVWRNFALAALALVVALLLSPSSTAVDRLAIYVMPLQLAVFSRLAIREKAAAGARSAVIVYSAAVLLVWLFFAGHAQYWLPYRSYLF